ncbi:hypothetical protein EC973_001753 [Apophysomyces ossiformis]|uniref:Uncharacterized protein n=1 Tax=Apophysomyces ossiformis TaxID=679940 RepID=A0A8H7EM65_9FUNG|nr:hypothetical protein EC973_001753 [Apophysomyces ossiformis]
MAAEEIFPTIEENLNTANAAVNAAVDQLEGKNFEQHVTRAMEDIRLSNEMYATRNREIYQTNMNLQVKLDALLAKLHGIQLALRDTEETIVNSEQQQSNLSDISSLEADISKIKEEIVTLQEESSRFPHEEDLDIVTNPITCKGFNLPSIDLWELA